MVNNITYATQRKMNRPIKFFGLSSTQATLAMAASMAIFVIFVLKNSSVIELLFVIFIIAASMTFLIGKMNKEQKKGNLYYLSGLSVKSATPKKIIDKSNFFKLIKL